MSAPQLLVQAVLNRLTSRVGSGLADAAASLAVLAREAPEKLQHDWDLFWEEVQLEAERLDSAGGGTGPAADAGSPGPDVSPAAAAAAGARSPQEQIDELRALVAALARRLEGST